MNKSRRVCGLVLALFTSPWMACEVHAQAAAALVLDKQGTSKPELSPYSEIPDGGSVSLSPQTKLVFVHYGTCRTVTVVGGRVTFRAETYSVTGASWPQ